MEVGFSQEMHEKKSELSPCNCIQPNTARTADPDIQIAVASQKIHPRKNCAALTMYQSNNKWRGTFPRQFK